MTDLHAELDKAVKELDSVIQKLEAEHNVTVDVMRSYMCSPNSRNLRVEVQKRYPTSPQQEQAA